jgi:hypothetical protein
MCCKVMAIKELNKPPLRWCDHCAIGKGCTIYETRPQSCGTFMCGWLAYEQMGPEWRPDRSKIVMFADEDGRRIVFDCDTAAPAAWRDRKFLPTIMQYGAAAEATGNTVLVCVGTQMYFIGRERVIDLGRTRHTHGIRRNWSPQMGFSNVEAVPVDTAALP